MDVKKKKNFILLYVNFIFFSTQLEINLTIFNILTDLNKKKPIRIGNL
jgi:hypothetical protein